MSQTIGPSGDEAILDLYFARDERAIAETQNSYGRVCMQVSMGILGNAADAEECVSDAYLKLWNTIPPKRPQSLCAYLCRIARNLSINRLRKLTAPRRNRELTVSLSELETCIPSPEEVSNAEELSRLIATFLWEQSETDRRLFLGRYWYMLSVKDLAVEWDMTPNAVSLHLHKTRERLRIYLEKRGYTV